MASLADTVGQVFQPSNDSDGDFVPDTSQLASTGEVIIPSGQYFDSDSDFGYMDSQTIDSVNLAAANSYRLGTMSVTDTVLSTGGTYPPYTYDIIGVNGDQILLGGDYQGNSTWESYLFLSNTNISLDQGYNPPNVVFSNTNPYAYSASETNALSGRTFISAFVSQAHFDNPVLSNGTYSIAPANYYGSDADLGITDSQTVTSYTTSTANSYRLGTIALTDQVATGGTYPAFTYDIVAENSDQILLGSEYQGNDQWGDYVILSNSDISLQDSGDTGFSGAFSFVNQDVYDPNATAPCFAAGTLISTPSGAVAVETLRAGDLVRTLDGADRPIVWAGHRRVDLRRHASPELARPVRIAAGAFAPAMPATALAVSPDHNLFVDGVLIPAKCLVNGRNVVELDVPAVTYHHIELETHDVVLANGMPAETYLDTGNRANFAGGDTTVAHPDFFSAPDLNYFAWIAEGCAPLVLTGPELDAVRARLVLRADAEIVLAA